MCGIAGFMTADGTTPPVQVLNNLADALAHRGPDGRGRYLMGDVGLVQTRLAIIDISGGDQPLYAPNGCVLVANGEVYNYVELRSELDGVNFRTGSDCEPPLHLYCRHGLGFASWLRGMYAIAIHDPVRNRLVLARDPFGIKPLYYADTPYGFAFASEPQALIATGFVVAQERRQAVSELLQLQFTTGRETVFEGIERVLPGETLVIQGGHIVERHRLDALPVGGPAPLDEGMAMTRLDEVLAHSVGMHQRADVPYGMFLSGGIDSSAILALMARLNPQPVVAYTAGFSGTQARDERDHARAVAIAAGAHHVEIDVTEHDFWTMLPEIAAAMDDPAADYAIVPTYKLAQEARRDVKVILSGEGGDELFGGYGRYRSAMRPWPFGRAMRRSGTFDGLGLLRDRPAGWRRGIEAAEKQAVVPGRSRLQQAQAVDVADWLPNDLLGKLDRCLMAHGVEGRVPFLDPLVADFAFRLPDNLKVKKRLGKWLLRRWLDSVMPEAKPFEPKRGFTVPVAEWIARRPDLGPLIARQPCIEELCRPGKVERLFAAPDRKTGFAAWTLLYYALWHRRHILGKLPEGDVFETLAAR